MSDKSAMFDIACFVLTRGLFRGDGGGVLYLSGRQAGMQPGVSPDFDSMMCRSQQRKEIWTDQVHEPVATWERAEAVPDNDLA